MIKKISNKLNIPEEQVKEVVNHFFGEVKKHVQTGDRPIVRLPFGSFIIRDRRLDYYIMNRVRFFKENRDKYTENNKEKLSKLLIIRNKWKNYIAQKRKQYKPNNNG